MLPNSITFQNYRSFTGGHEFELKPLTLIYGANNVGKSALLRLFPLLGDSVAADATGALRLESPAGFGAGFDDLESKCASDSEPGDLNFGLRWQTGPLAEAEFVFERRDREGVYIRELGLRLRDGSSNLFTRTPHRREDDPFGQRLLAEFLVDTAAAPSQPRLVVETHSQALLLGVQLAIAKGNSGLSHEDVAIYWVEQDELGRSMISPVTVDANGRLNGNWPDPFGEIPGARAGSGHASDGAKPGMIIVIADEVFGVPSALELYQFNPPARDLGAPARLREVRRR